MVAPVGALQRAVLVAVPLALLVMIFATPALIGRPQPPATAIPFLLVETARQRWDNTTYNETALLYVRSALGTPLYDYVAINVTGVGSYNGTRWTANGTRVPSVWLKFPVNATAIANVTAVAMDAAATYRYNATIEFRFDQGWVLRVTPEGDTSYRDYTGSFSVGMRQEVPP